MNCPNCGYDLCNLASQRCPECGSPFDARRLGRQPGAQLHGWLQRETWWSRAAAIPRLCIRPSVAIGADASLDVDFAPVAPRLLAWALLWHAALSGLVLATGAALGATLGVWDLNTASALAQYLVHSAFLLLFDLLLWVIISLAVAWAVLWAWRQRVEPGNLLRLVSLAFALSTGGEGVRRVLHLLAALSVELTDVGPDLDLWHFSGVAGYGVYALMVWNILRTLAREVSLPHAGQISAQQQSTGSPLEEALTAAFHSLFRALRMGASSLPFVVLFGALTIFWRIETGLFGLWFRSVEAPVLRALGLW